MIITVPIRQTLLAIFRKSWTTVLKLNTFYPQLNDHPALTTLCCALDMTEPSRDNKTLQLCQLIVSELLAK